MPEPLTWRRAERAASASAPGPRWTAGPTLLVPVGSLEQHGPHLPLDTDTADRRRRGPRAAAGDPSLLRRPAAWPTGRRGSTRASRARCRSGTRRCGRLLVELGRSAGRWASRLVFVNGHGGNLPTRRRRPSPCCGTRAGTWPGSAAPPGGDAHAGRTETSMLLALDPALVRTDAAAAGNTAPLRELMPALRAGGVAAVSPNGVLGDPAGRGGRGRAPAGGHGRGAARRPRPLEPRPARPAGLSRAVAKFSRSHAGLRATKSRVARRCRHGRLARRRRATRGFVRARSGRGPAAGGPAARRAGQRAVLAGQRRDQPGSACGPDHRRGAAGGHDDVADPVATRGATGPNQPVGDGLLAGHHPGVVAEHGAPGREHVGGGAGPGVDVPGARVAAEQEHAAPQVGVGVGVERRGPRRPSRGPRSPPAPRPAEGARRSARPAGRSGRAASATAASPARAGGRARRGRRGSRSRAAGPARASAVIISAARSPSACTPRNRPPRSAARVSPESAERRAATPPSPRRRPRPPARTPSGSAGPPRAGSAPAGRRRSPRRRGPVQRVEQLVAPPGPTRNVMPTIPWRPGGTPVPSEARLIECSTGSPP